MQLLNDLCKSVQESGKINCYDENIKYVSIYRICKNVF